MPGTLGNDRETFAEIMQRTRGVVTETATARANWVKTIQLASKYEHEYRVAYAKALVAAEGRTQEERTANAKAAVAELCAKRDVAQDMKRVWEQDVRGLDGQRANWNTMAKWAQSLEPGLGG